MRHSPSTTALLWSLAPWPAVLAGLSLFRSAVAAFALYHAVCLLGAWVLRPRGPEAPKTAPLPWWLHLGVALGANVGLVLAWRLTGNFLLDPEQLRAALAELGITKASYPWLFPYFLLVNPIVEERFWRVGVYATLRREWAAPCAARISAGLFGAWHWLVVRLLVAPWVAVVATLGIAAVGIALAYVWERTGRRRDIILLHSAAADLPLLVILALSG